MHRAVVAPLCSEGRRRPSPGTRLVGIVGLLLPLFAAAACTAPRNELPAAEPMGGGDGGASLPASVAVVDAPSDRGPTALTPGAACATGGECASNACVDGRCCGEHCRPCETCTGPGGTCVAIASGEDRVPAGTCVAPSFCQAGACQVRRAGGDPCASAADCSSGSCTGERCCAQPSCPACQACTGPGGSCALIAAFSTGIHHDGVYVFGKHAAAAETWAVGQGFEVATALRLQEVAFQLDGFKTPSGSRADVEIAFSLRDADGKALQTARRTMPAAFEGGWFVWPSDAVLQPGRRYFVTMIPLDTRPRFLTSTAWLINTRGAPASGVWCVAAEGETDTACDDWSHWSADLASLNYELRGCPP
jgi:hypothetical protein